MKLELVRNKGASECVARFETLWRADTPRLVGLPFSRIKEGFDDLCAERGCEHMVALQHTRT